MSTWFFILTLLFIVLSAGMILIILVQRPQGGGLAGAFGGAGGGGTDTVFGGRVGDALTWATVVAFVLYLLLAVGLNRVPSQPGATAAGPPPAIGATGPTGAAAPATAVPSGDTLTPPIVEPRPVVPAPITVPIPTGPAAPVTGEPPAEAPDGDAQGTASGDTPASEEPTDDETP